jgi:rod shape determining protein RodA
MFNKKILSNIDIFLIVVIFLISLIGVLAIYSATPADFYKKQIVWIALGFVILFVSCLFDYRDLNKWAYIGYFFGIFLLILVRLKGVEYNYAKRWLNLGFFHFQPSELNKIFIIIIMAKYLSTKKKYFDDWNILWKLLVIVAVPLSLIIIQPDFLFCFSLILSPFLWYSLRPYQQGRIMIFLNPSMDIKGTGWAVLQSKIAIGSGGLWGQGWLRGSQIHLSFLTERHTDFIFSVIGEEWGFIGIFILLTLFSILFVLGLKIAFETKDKFGMLIAIGISCSLVAHVFINIGMCMGIVPVVGLPLPLVSYGGSSFLTNMIGLSLLLNIKMRTANR